MGLAMSDKGVEEKKRGEDENFLTNLLKWK